MIGQQPRRELLRAIAQQDALRAGKQTLRDELIGHLDNGMSVKASPPRCETDELSEHTNGVVAGPEWWGFRVEVRA